MRLGSKNIFEGSNRFGKITFWSFYETNPRARERQADPRKSGFEDQRFHENAYLSGQDVDATWNKKYFRGKHYFSESSILVFL